MLLSDHWSRTLVTELVGSFVTNMVLSGAVFASSIGTLEWQGGDTFIGTMFATVSYIMSYGSGWAVAPAAHLNPTLTVAMVLLKREGISRALVGIMGQVSPAHRLTVSLSDRLTVSLSHHHTVSLSHRLTVSLSHCLTVSPALCLTVSHCPIAANWLGLDHRLSVVQ